jgi:hypothetical protein
MPGFCLAILSLISISAAAQEKNEAAIKRCLVSFSVGGVPIPGNPTSLLPGVEFYITPRVSVFNEVALQTQKNKDFDSTALNKKYFKYKAEARFYLFDKAKRVMPYLALQYTTAKRNFNVNKSWTYYDTFQDDSIYSYSRASINSPIQTITGQFGLAIRVYDNFYIDFSMGLGARHINTSYSLVENLQKIRNRQLFNINLNSSYRFNGSITRAQLNMGFRVSYRF